MLERSSSMQKFARVGLECQDYPILTIDSYLDRTDDGTMRKRSSRDVNEMATSVIESVIRKADSDPIGKNPAAVALGRLGGKKGGPARAAALSGKKKSEIARKAAIARWKANNN